ncbi:MAG: hypothetical protein AB1411_10250 [Nitrospirota bacterium]
MARIAVLCVHGMGNQDASFADDMVEELRDRISDEGVNPDLFAFGSAWWGKVMEGAENDLYRDLSKDNDLSWEELRKDIVISGFGDALAYVGPPNSESEVYDEIHDELAKAIEELKDDLEDPPRTPLIVMAHSLGCAIVSNYVWDAQRHERYPASARSQLARCKTLLGLIMFGCNIPLFTLAYRKSDIEPISLPGELVYDCFPGQSKAKVDAACKWLNFYDPDDVLGYPLKPINRAYARVVTEDIAIDTGTILGAHTDYWTDNDFTEPVTEYFVQVAALV